MGEKKQAEVKSIVADIVGCKWSLSIIDLMAKGINRPGAMTRGAVGLTPKVLHERLKKLQRYQVIYKVEYDELPPRVEYNFTAFGQKFLRVIEVIKELEKDAECIEISNI